MQTHTINGLFLRLSSWPLEERPTLIMLHGSGNTGALWDAQLAGLSEVANVVAVDLSGHGRSEGPLPTSVDEHASQIAQLIPALGLSKAIVSGLSLGGAIALQLMLDHDDVVEGGILLGTGARLRVMPMILEMIVQDFEAFVQGIPMGAASPSTDVELLQPLMRAMLDNGSEVASSDFRSCDVFDVLQRLDEIECPVLVVSGEHDALTPPKYSKALVEGIRGAQLVSVPDAGHLAPVEQPEAVNRAIRQWLASLPSQGYCRT